MELQKTIFTVALIAASTLLFLIMGLCPSFNRWVFIIALWDKCRSATWQCGIFICLCLRVVQYSFVRQLSILLCEPCIWKQFRLRTFDINLNFHVPDVQFCEVTANLVGHLFDSLCVSRVFSCRDSHFAKRICFGRHQSFSRWLCRISKCLSNLVWWHRTLANPSFLVQNAGFGASSGDFLGSNFGTSFVTEARLKFSRWLFIIVMWGSCRSAAGQWWNQCVEHDPMRASPNHDPLGEKIFDGRWVYEGEDLTLFLKSIKCAPLAANQNEADPWVLRGRTCLDDRCYRTLSTWGEALCCNSLGGDFNPSKDKHCQDHLPSIKSLLGRHSSPNRRVVNIVSWILRCYTTTQCCGKLSSHQFLWPHHNYDPLIAKPFDGTCGYEGEGPQWTLKSINVGSLEKNPQVLKQACDALAIQETRVTAANKKEVTLRACEANRDISFGPLMKYMESGHPEWGGVAVATNHGSSRVFEIKEDASGLYHSLLASTRVHCVWTSVDFGKTMLLISFYGFSGAHQDPAKHVACDNLLRQVFEFASQFGSIPIAICGDFQTIPHSYSCIRDLLAMGRYHDPFLMVDEGLDRPYTFCKNRQWHDHESPKTSIDGILVNDVAFNYIKAVSISQDCGLQHAFCEIEFDFPSTRRTGFKWIPHAKLDLSKLKPEPQRTQIASQLWEQTFCQQCMEADSGEKLAEIANEYCIQILVEAGAKWTQGTRKRGTMPDFQYGNRDFQKSDSNDAFARSLDHLDKSLRRINDLMKNQTSIRACPSYCSSVLETHRKRFKAE